MKKAVIFAAAIVGSMTLAAAPMQAQAAPMQIQVKGLSGQAQTKVVEKGTGNTDDTCLKDYLDSSKWENYKMIEIPCQSGKPDINIPGVPGEKPETPDSSKPGLPENKPETPDNKPGTPDIEQPGDSNQSEHAYVLRVVELVNAERAKAGLKPLTLQKDVTKAAQVRAVEIEKSFSHTRPNGTNFATALKEAGVTYRGSGENIAWGQKTPEEVMKGWMNSPGHRANILNANYTSIGVGYHQNASGTNYWSQLFTY